MILRGMVDIDAGYVEHACRREMIDPGLDAIGVSAPFEIEVLGYELILARMLANQRRLPRQILRHQASLKLSEGG